MSGGGGKRRSSPLHDAASLTVNGLLELQAECERAQELLSLSEKTIERKNGELEHLKDRVDYLERQVAYYMRFTTEVVTHFKIIKTMMSGSFGDISGLMDVCIEKAKAEAYAPSGVAAKGPLVNAEMASGDPPPKFLTDALMGLRRTTPREEELLAGVAASLAPVAPNGAGDEAHEAVTEDARQ